MLAWVWAHEPFSVSPSIWLTVKSAAMLRILVIPAELSRAFSSQKSYDLISFGLKAR